jgi:hypothetical protein
MYSIERRNDIRFVEVGLGLTGLIPSRDRNTTLFPRQDPGPEPGTVYYKCTLNADGKPVFTKHIVGE